MDRMIRMTNQNLIDELEKVSDKTKKILVEDYEDNRAAISGVRPVTDEDEDIKTVLQVTKFIPYVNFEKDFDRDVYTLSCEQLIQHLKQFDREFFTIIGIDVGGRFTQSVTEDDKHVIISSKIEKNNEEGESNG